MTKTLGLIGGTGWVSTVEYYRLINLYVNERLGGLSFARLVLYSLSYGDIDALNQRNDLEGVYKLIREATHKVLLTGVDAIMLCANTLHLFADRLQREISKPILHIADATANEILAKKKECVGLLGTKTTMEENFYTKKLMDKGIRTLIPDEQERNFIHSSILNELLKSEFRQETRQRFLAIINELVDRGAEGVVLGCTEIPLLVKPEHTTIPLFNTLEIHARYAAEFACA